MTHRPTAPRSAVMTWMDASSRHQPLCESTVIELSRRVQRWQRHPAGPSQAPKPMQRSALRARDQLVHHNLRLVAHTWQRQSHGVGLAAGSEDTVDALQEAAMNLVRAAEMFDPAKGYRFSTYATFWVQRGFNDYQQRCMRTIRFPAAKAALMLKAQRLIRQQVERTGQAPDHEWLAAQLRLDGKALTPAAFDTMVEQWRQTCTEPLDPTTEPDNNWLHERRMQQATLNHAAQQEREEQAEEESKLLRDLLQQLDEKEHRMIRNRYLRQPRLSPCQLRRAMGGMEPEQQAQLEQQALEKLRNAAKQLKQHKQSTAS